MRDLLVMAIQGLVLAPSLSSAQSFSTDITVTLGPITARPNEIVMREGGQLTIDGQVVPIPAAADLVAFHRIDHQAVLFVLDITVELAPGILATPRRVMRLEGGQFSVEYDVAAQGLAEGVRIDALSVRPGGELVLSFDTAAVLLGQTWTRNDLVAVPSGDEVLHAADFNLPPELNLNAVHVLGTEEINVSFSTSASLSGVFFADEDIVRLNLQGMTVGVELDASSVSTNLIAAELDAIYGALIGLPIFKDGFEDVP